MMEGVVALFSMGVLLAVACMFLLVAVGIALLAALFVYAVFKLLRWAMFHAKQAGTGGME